jgi:hypothetical protein
MSKSIVQVHSLLHDCIHGGGIKSPQLQGRDERDVGCSRARKTYTDIVSGGRQHNLIEYVWVLVTIDETCVFYLDFKPESRGWRTGAKKVGVEEGHADHVSLKRNCRQDVARLASIL